MISIKRFFVAVAIVAVSFSASANVVVFTGDYSLSNWTSSTEGDGSIVLNGSPWSPLGLTLTSADNGGGMTNQDFTIVSTLAGIVNFSWDYATNDKDGPSYDGFGWLLNNNFFEISDDSGSNSQAGTSSFAVNIGDTFGFRQSSSDSVFGSGSTAVSQFSIVSPVPESSILGLMLGSLGLVGFMVYRKRKAQA